MHPAQPLSATPIRTRTPRNGLGPSRSRIQRGLALVLALVWATSDHAAAPFEIGPDLYRQASAAGVEILVNHRHAGSGWIATSDGIVVTAHHVIDSDKPIQVLLPRTYMRADARLLSEHPGHDLALLRIESPGLRFDVLQPASRMPQPGEPLFLYGAPIFRHGMLMHGRLARATTGFEYYPDQKLYIECLHVSGLAPGGVSGGPWLNAKGEVVGLQSGSMTVGTALYGVSFMIPVSAVERALKNPNGPRLATLGAAVEETWQQDRHFLDKLKPDTDGLVVRKLTPNGPAQKAGIREMEIIVRADDQPVRLPDQLLGIVRSKPPGEKIVLEVLDRTGTDSRTVTATLDAL